MKNELEILKGVGMEDMISYDILLKNLEECVCLLVVGKQQTNPNLDDSNVHGVYLAYASPSFYQTFHLKGEFFKLPCDLSETGIHPDDEADYRKRLSEAASTAQAFTHIHRLFKNGSDWSWHRCRCVWLKNLSEQYALLLEVSTDISDLVDTDTLLRESNERLLVALEQIPQVLWEVSLKEKIFSRYDVKTQSCSRGTEMENFPEGMIERGIIHPDSAEVFRHFAEGLLRGNKGGSANVIMKNPSGCRYEWFSLSYHMIFDRSGSPVKAIGIQQKLPSESISLAEQPHRHPLPQAVRHHLLGYLRANLTEDTLLDNWIDGMERTEWTGIFSYTESLNDGDMRHFVRGEGKEFNRRFSRENLIQAYQRGEFWSSREYHRVDAGGEIGWMQERIVLYYIIRNNVRKVSKDMVRTWLYTDEIFEVNIDNAFDLLSSVGGGSVVDDTLELGIDLFRKYSANAQSLLTGLKEYVDKHRKLASDMFMKLWNANTLDSVTLLFICYIVDERIESFGDRWMAEGQIRNIQQWEIKHSLDSTLSSNYGTSLQFLIQNNLVHESSWTSYGNPREYSLYPSIRNLLFNCPKGIQEALQAIKDKHYQELPF